MTTSRIPRSDTTLAQIQPPKLVTELAKPWHFRRHGRYYLRFRPRNQTLGVFTISLRTSDRATAMEISRNIQRALSYFHLEKPNATWPELRDRLQIIAQECLEAAHGNSGADWAHGDFYSEMHWALRSIGTRGDLSIAQHRAVAIGQSIMAAANARIEGRVGPLVEIIDQLDASPEATPGASVSLSVGAPQEPLTWDELTTQYLAEHSINLKEASRQSAIATYKVLGEAMESIGLVDLRAHTRAQMVAVRDKLLETRKPSTVNDRLTKLKTVLDWAERSDKLPKHYAHKLKIAKGAESSRTALTREQVLTLMAHAKTLPFTSWERWMLELACITGARVGELSYLGRKDVYQKDGLWCIDINEDSPGKSIKNKHSKRLVPLVDGALGFDLRLFLEGVEQGGMPAENNADPINGSKRMNRLLKSVLGSSKEKTQTFHSLRHHLISSMQAAGVPVAFAQAAAGQATGTIAYDNYGSGSPIQRVFEALKQGLTESTG